MLILGLAPAAHGANRTGRVFTGDGGGGSGDFLMRALHENGFASAPVSQRPDDGLTLTDAFIAATVRCAPPDNKPTPEEVLACRVHLDAEWDALPRVQIVVALGRVSFDACWARFARRGIVVRRRPPFAHGAEYKVTRRPARDCVVPSQPAEHEYGKADGRDDARRVRAGGNAPAVTREPTAVSEHRDAG